MNLDKYEKEILEAYDQGELKSEKMSANEMDQLAQLLLDAVAGLSCFPVVGVDQTLEKRSSEVQERFLVRLLLHVLQLLLLFTSYLSRLIFPGS